MEHQPEIQEDQEKTSSDTVRNLISTDSFVGNSAVSNELKNVSTNNDEASYSKNVVNHSKKDKGGANVKRTPEAKTPNSEMKKSPLSSSEKKKNRTPPKSKYNSQQKNGNQRGIHNKKFNVNTDGPDDLIDSPIYGLNNNNNTNAKSGSKKNNLNHLLNFSYVRETNENYEYERFSKQFWSNKIAKSSYFSKEQFLQANCQFVIKNTGDYTVHLVDPDRLVEWSMIEEIHIDSNEIISCPICLYPPQAGKMTKCGHIFCWSCILHYLSLSDKPWRKCPICYESIYKHDLKSVLQNTYSSDFKINDIIEFELIFKSKSKLNTIILPFKLFDLFREDERKNKTVSFDIFNAPEYEVGKKYLKMLSKSAEDINKSVLQRERCELELQLEETKGQPEVCFVDEAMNLLAERESSLKSITSPENKKGNLKNSFDKMSLNDEKDDEKDYTFFYQSKDGQRIYLNPFNARIMMAQYATLNNGPENISGKILGMESHFMSEENRKRYKHLAHLPLHSEFKVAEIELKEPFVTADTLMIFESEIYEKKRFRDRKLLKEKRIAERFDQSIYENPHYFNSSAMNEPIYLANSNNNAIDYTNDFPEASRSPSTSSSGISNGSAGVNINDSSKEAKNKQSFAQMTRYPTMACKTANSFSSSAWPTLEQPSSTNLAQQLSQPTNNWLSMAKLGHVLGRSTKVQAPPTPWSKNSIADYEYEDAENAEYMPAPGFKESFFSAIDNSLKLVDEKKMNAWEAELLSNGFTEEVKTTQQISKKKKKKTKQLLFSTH